MNGVLVVYKEKGFTSFDVVAKLRNVLHQKHMGHSGTLDPEAEGVLPVCIGSATKMVELLTGSHKVYRALMLLGVETDTQDTTGTVLEKRPVPQDEEAVRSAVMSFVGTYEQLPPMFSAKKVGGKKLCDLARAGKEIERKSVPVTIHGIEILSMDLPLVTLRVECSRGTYIRTLCHDIGQKLGCGGTMEALLREEAGGFSLKDALTLNQIEALQLVGRLEPHVFTPERLMEAYPRYVCRPSADKAAWNGNSLHINSGSFEGDEPADGGPLALYLSDGRLVGLYRFDAKQQRLSADVMLNGKEEEIPRSFVPAPSVVTIGKFDGLHIGHRALIEEMKAVRGDRRMRLTAFSFSESPQAFLEKKKQNNLLSHNEKRQRAKELGLDFLTEFPFTEEIRQMSAEHFLKDILIGRLGMKEIVVGTDCAFGFERRGNVGFLREHAEEYGYGVTVVEKVRLNGLPVSSSLIRSYLAEGRMEEVNEALGYPFSFTGPVVRGKQLGRQLGVPTINQMIPEDKQFPLSGVYAARILLDGQIYEGMANVGIKPTIAGVRKPGLETHLFDFDGDVYGRKAETQLLHFIRREKKFETVDALQRQLVQDEKEIRAYFAEHAAF